MPASCSSTPTYTPATPDTTAEKKASKSEPRYPPSEAAPIHEYLFTQFQSMRDSCIESAEKADGKVGNTAYSPCARLQLNFVSVPSIVASSS